MCLSLGLPWCLPYVGNFSSLSYIQLQQILARCSIWISALRKTLPTTEFTSTSGSWSLFWILAPIFSVTYSMNQCIYLSHLSWIYGKSHVHKVQKHFYWPWGKTPSCPYFKEWFHSMAWTEQLSLSQRRNFCFSLASALAHTPTAYLEQVLVLIWSQGKLIHLIKMAKKPNSAEKKK